ncbi:4Fe-4S binding protein [Clostridium sp. J1101437_171009_A5]|uniref:indolepyruvate ferredoxin oxidoreductase subunit alpha n=1 Tax=Clostridium sp. J1101437_171009_A5 TaxID=2787098 RepID=UPI00336BFC5D
MVVVNQEACKGCTLCEKNCPLDAVHIVERKAVVDEEKCAECGICTRVCKFGAISRPEKSTDGSVVCSSCPVQCHVPVGHTGACKRYTNENGKLVRNRKLVLQNDAVHYPDSRLNGPVITAVGAGTNYPCIRPAPHIVSEVRDGVEVVTVVTGASELFGRHGQAGYQYLHRRRGRSRLPGRQAGWHGQHGGVRLQDDRCGRRQ